jgi:hypothetical protein
MPSQSKRQMTPIQRLGSATVAFAISWALVAFVCVAVFDMSDGGAAAYAAASALAGILLHEWWRKR